MGSKVVETRSNLKEGECLGIKSRKEVTKWEFKRWFNQLNQISEKIKVANNINKYVPANALSNTQLDGVSPTIPN